MGRTLEARIRRAAQKVVKHEQALAEAEEHYQELIDEAHLRGVRVPRTILTNPLMPPQKHR